MKSTFLAAAVTGAMLLAAPAFGAGHAMMVDAKNQSVKGGTVTAAKIMAGSNGWLVVHRVRAGGKPGKVIGHAPLKKGLNLNVVAILTEKVKPGQKLMLMIHGEAGGKKTGIFEYTLGSPLDGPVRHDGKLVVKVITAQ